MTDRIADTIVSAIMESEKPFRKIVFVGVKAPWHSRFGMIKQKGIIVNFIDDYEKAKEWLFQRRLMSNQPTGYGKEIFTESKVKKLLWAIAFQNAMALFL